MKPLTARSWSRDVKLAVDSFGRDYVVTVLRVPSSALDGWLRGRTIPDEGSTLRARLATLLAE